MGFWGDGDIPAWFLFGRGSQYHFLRILSKNYLESPHRCGERLDSSEPHEVSRWTLCGTRSEGQLMGYRAMDLPGLDYGCLAFGTAAKTTLQKLEIVQAAALQIYDGSDYLALQMTSYGEKKKKNEEAYLKLTHCLMLLPCIAQ